MSWTLTEVQAGIRVMPVLMPMAYVSTDGEMPVRKAVCKHGDAHVYTHALTGNGDARV